MRMCDCLCRSCSTTVKGLRKYINNSLLLRLLLLLIRVNLSYLICILLYGITFTQKRFTILSTKGYIEIIFTIKNKIKITFTLWNPPGIAFVWNNANEIPGTISFHVQICRANSSNVSYIFVLKENKYILYKFCIFIWTCHKLHVNTFNSKTITKICSMK